MANRENGLFQNPSAARSHDLFFGLLRLIIGSAMAAMYFSSRQVLPLDFAWG